MNQQAVPRGKWGPQNTLKLERWQGPPHFNKVKQYEVVLSFKVVLFIQSWQQRESVCLVCSGITQMSQWRSLFLPQSYTASPLTAFEFHFSYSPIQNGTVGWIQYGLANCFFLSFFFFFSRLGLRPLKDFLSWQQPEKVSLILHIAPPRCKWLHYLQGPAEDGASAAQADWGGVAPSLCFTTWLVFKGALCSFGIDYFCMLQQT